MAKFRKKPIVIEATQFHIWDEPWPDGVEQRTVSGNAETIQGAQVEWFIQTLEGEHVVVNDDWIITGIKGEKYPCKPDIFAATYEPA